jgi:hypothetical protein
MTSYMQVIVAITASVLITAIVLTDILGMLVQR